MKERLELLLAQKLAQIQYGQLLEHPAARAAASVAFAHLPRSYGKNLWIGTFHALFARMLR